MFAIGYFCLRPCIDGFSVSGNLTLERPTPLSVPLTCWPTPRQQIARSGITLTMGLLTLRYCACAHRHPARFVQQAYACTCQATAAPALTRSLVHVAAVAGCASSSTLSVSASWWGHCRAGTPMVLLVLVLRYATPPLPKRICCCCCCCCCATARLGKDRLNVRG